MLSVELCEYPQHLAGYLWLKPFNAQQLSCPVSPYPLRPIAIGLRQFSGLALLLSILSCCIFAFLCRLPVWFVTFLEGLSFWHLYGCLVGGC